MRLNEFSGEDLTQYKLMTGTDLFVAFNALVSEFNILVTEHATLLPHRTIIVDYKTRLSRFEDKLISMHDYCLASEDDSETDDVAKTVKDMYNKINIIFTSL